MRDSIKGCLLFAAIGFLAGWASFLPIFGEKETHHYHTTTTVKVDTLRHPPVYLPVPGPERTRIDTHYLGGGEASVVYLPSPPDTVYADCDSAHRYESEYSDSLVKIKVKADICGRLLATQFSYTCYQRTITRTLSEPLSISPALYVVANTTPGVGMHLVAQKWLIGYQYQFTQPSASMAAHQLTAGLLLWRRKKANGIH